MIEGRILWETRCTTQKFVVSCLLCLYCILPATATILLHVIALHCRSFQYTSLYSLHCASLPLHIIAHNCSPLHFTTHHCISLLITHCTPLHFVARLCTKYLLATELHCTSLRGTAPWSLQQFITYVPISTCTYTVVIFMWHVYLRWSHLPQLHTSYRHVLCHCKQSLRSECVCAYMFHSWKYVSYCMTTGKKNKTTRRDFLMTRRLSSANWLTQTYIYI